MNMRTSNTKAFMSLVGNWRMELDSSRYADEEVDFETIGDTLYVTLSEDVADDFLYRYENDEAFSKRFQGLRQSDKFNGLVKLAFDF
jgi:hypothetical protein